MRGLGRDQDHRPFHRSRASCFRLACFVFFFSRRSLPMVRIASDKQISWTFPGFFKEKLQFSRTKILYSINRHSLTPFWTPHSLKHAMQSFTIFTSSAMADHINILFYFPSTTLWKWLRWLTIALDIAHAQKCLMKRKWISKIFQDLMKKSGTFQGPLLNSRTFQDIY